MIPARSAVSHILIVRRVGWGCKISKNNDWYANGRRMGMQSYKDYTGEPVAKAELGGYAQVRRATTSNPARIRH
jgi:hypothetical protein